MLFGRTPPTEPQHSYDNCDAKQAIHVGLCLGMCIFRLGVLRPVPCMKVLHGGTAPAATFSLSFQLFDSAMTGALISA